jgi:glycosyltransferase involved in cell wall biosynthesis
MKLTITIPTFNRPQQIQDQVRSVLKQLTEDVALVVIDNCSTPAVESYFTAEELSKFTIIRNKVNIGRDQNQVRCLEYVNEGWAWTLSDDDSIRDDAVQMVLEAIERYSDCIYINFSNKKDMIITDYEDLLKYLSIIGAFGISFFQSVCIYNMDKISKSLMWFNDFLSSQIGQICMVIKHMELNQNEKCVFLRKSLLIATQPGGWDPLHLITNSSIIIDKFYYSSDLMRPTLYKALGDMYLTKLSQTQITVKSGWYYFSYICFKLGIWNILRYNFTTLAGFLVSKILPKKYYGLLRSKVAKSYNRKIATKQ